MRIYFLVVIFSICAYAVQAQNSPEEKLIQLSGTILSTDTVSKPVPFVTVYDKNTQLGTVAAYNGFYSIVCYPNDTLQFSSISYYPSIVVVPATASMKLTQKVYMKSRSDVLPQTFVYPWGGRDNFPYAFANSLIPDDYITRAQKNLDRSALERLAKTMPPDPYLNNVQTMQQVASNYYFRGTLPTSNLFNPFAWAQFFSMLKDGYFKNPDTGN
jgi:hypothetical protein